MTKYTVDPIYRPKCGIGFINMDGAKMESNELNVSFRDKTKLIAELDRLHDSTCRFQVITENRIKLNLHTMDNGSSNLIISLKNKVNESVSIYEYSIKAGRIKGRIVGNDGISDLEGLRVELIDFLFTDLDLAIHACDRTPKGLGKDKLIRFSEVLDIAFVIPS